MVNARSDFCAPLKAFGGKEETGNTPESGNKPAKRPARKPACHLYE
jgi:hypothetical protein